MSEVQTRPFAPRGRGSGRGGRSTLSSGGRGNRAHGSNSNKPEVSPSKIEEDGEVGQLRKLYSSQVAMIKEMFPDWSDEDIVFALRETEGNLELTVERITDGTISQWGEVSKVKKSRYKSTAKETSVTPGEATNQTRASRGGRAGFENSRGSRGRGGKSRGASNTQVIATRKTNTGDSIPTDEWTAWKKPSSGDKSAPHKKLTKDNLDTSNLVGDRGDIASDSVKAPATIVSDGAQKSWATLFAPVPVSQKSTAPHTERPVEPIKLEELAIPSPTESLEPTSKPILGDPVSVTQMELTPAEVVEADIIPLKTDLTEDNLEQLPDTSLPIPTTTVASTAASSWDPNSGANNSSLYTTSQLIQQQGIRSTPSIQNSVLKVSTTSGRTPSYQRRIFEQEEAVRMPGNREIDRAAVQFGAFNLKDNDEDDVDGDREDAETRAQPPQHSPVAPRASLPPVNQQTNPALDLLPSTKPISGHPAASHPPAVAGLPSPAPLSSAPAAIQQVPQTNGQLGQYSRFSQDGTPDKPYDTFNQQTPSEKSPFEGYPLQPQTQSQPQTAHSGTFSPVPNDYSSYYASDPQQRNAYNNYYQPQYGSQHQGAQTAQGQDVPATHQRSYNGYNGPPGENLSQFPPAASHQPQSRYVPASEGQNSGHTTPNPVSQAPHPGAMTQTGQPQASQPQAGQQPQVPGTYHYGHPYFSSPYYSAYMNHYPNYGNGNFPGGPYAAKTAINQHFQGYNISPAPPFEHTASPGIAGFGASSVHGRDSALGVLSEFGRTGSAQSNQNPQNIGNTTFNIGHDTFSRGSSYQAGQSQPHFTNQQVAQQGVDDMKPYNESKTTNGANSSLQGGRPGSATNTGPGGSALPQQQSQQAGYNNYPAHMQQPSHNLHGSHSGSQFGSQYGALGGTGLQHQASGQGHHSSQYGGYQGFGGGSYYNNSQQRGGWGGNYGH